MTAVMRHRIHVLISATILAAILGVMLNEEGYCTDRNTPGSRYVNHSVTR